MDLTGAPWRRSSRSGTNGGNCVEIATDDRQVAVRDSKDHTGPVLAFTEGEWTPFITAVKDGRLRPTTSR